MNYLTDSEIIEWNNIIEDINYRVIPSYNNRNGYPSIKFDTNIYYTDMYDIDSKNINIDPIIKHDISFSILELGKDIFFKIKNQIFSNLILNEIVYSENNYKRIDLSELIITNNEYNFIYKNKNFIKYNFSLEGKTSSVMTFYSLIKRALNFFSKMWGMNSENIEGFLLKYKIGDVVTTKDNILDMIIIDYYFNVYNNTVDYITEEIIDKGSHIIFGDKKTLSEKSIFISRNNKIETLLED